MITLAGALSVSGPVTLPVASWIGLDGITLTATVAEPYQQALLCRRKGASVSEPDYVFTSRRETPEEYRERTGPAAPAALPDPAPGTAPAGRQLAFQLIAGFAEHDERLGATASVEVRRETAPGWAEAERLIWPAVLAATTRALGPGDWRPSLNWLDVIELLA